MHPDQTITLKCVRKFRYKITTWIDFNPKWVYTTAFSKTSLMFRIEQMLEKENSQHYPQITIQELN